MVNSAAKKSKMLPVGIWLSILGIVLPIVVSKLAWSIEFDIESARGLLLILAGVLALLLPVGIVLIIIGVVRNKKARSESAPR
jgi:hypothetical protein